MAKIYTKTQVEATEAMLLISKADGILARDTLRKLLCGGNARWYAMTPLVTISGSLTSRDLDMVK